MEIKNSISQLFKSEFSRMVAVLSKQFGIQHLAIIEDMVSETFVQAAETWMDESIPHNTAGWLYTVARNKTHKYFVRNRIFIDKVIPGFVALNQSNSDTTNDFFSDEHIQDSQLKMIFAICNPAIVTEAQIGLALRILGGFTVEEIAEAFFTNKETIAKRLYRAKEKLRREMVPMEIPNEHAMKSRLDTVLHVIYLFFNEGYYSISQNQILRKDLCAEALRLSVMLTQNQRTNLPKTNALVALMCYHASRFVARQGADHSPILYKDQDRALWDKDLILKGNYYLSQSGKGEEITTYHLEARIAYCHTEQDDAKDKWRSILKYYEQLLMINSSPMVALNRIYALFRVSGASVALEALNQFTLINNPFYFTLLGELLAHTDIEKALLNYQKAYGVAKSLNERKVLSDKINNLQNSSEYKSFDTREAIQALK